MTDGKFSPRERARAKAASRAKDEEDLASGRVTAAELSRINGGGRLPRGAVVVCRSRKVGLLLETLKEGQSTDPEA